MSRYSGRRAPPAGTSAAIAAALFAWAVGVPAASLPLPGPPRITLPQDAKLAETVGPDGEVVFSHTTHAAYVGLDCTVCHPSLFPILRPLRGVTHEVMDKGGSCGACHDGRRASGTTAEEACANCHSGWGKPHPLVRTKVVLASSQGSPGPVTFAHRSHLDAGLSCAGCHPSPFALKAAGTSLGPAGPPGHGQCGGCHAGGGVFGVEEEGACARCHRAEAEAAP